MAAERQNASDHVLQGHVDGVIQLELSLVLPIFQGFGSDEAAIDSQHEMKEIVNESSLLQVWWQGA